MITEVLFLIFWSAAGFSFVAPGGATVTPSTTAPPAAWFPNRRPEVFQSGETTTLYTAFREKAKFLTEDRTNFRFKAKACASAAITFEIMTKDNSLEYATLVLGDEGNRATTISYGGQMVASQLTPNIVHCSEARSFWVSWRTDKLQVGFGPVVGSYVITEASYVTPYVTSIRHTVALVLSSGLEASSVVWEVAENAADIFTFEAEMEAGYGMIWKDVYKRNFITFHVTACWDAQIILTSQHGDVTNKVYEIVLGADLNQKSFIRTAVGGGVVLVEVSGQVLSCLETRDFWVSWFNHAGQFGTVKVGKGSKYGKNIIMEVHDTDSPVDVRHLGVNSGFNVQAVWGFEEDIEETTILRTQLSSANTASPELLFRNVWLESVQSESMTLSVTACSKVAIHLSTTVGVDEEFGLMLIISNNRTVLKDMVAMGDLASAPTPGLLTCQHSQDFWLSWHDSHIKFGSGRIPEQEVIVEADAPVKRKYYALALSSYDMPALWVIKARYSENLELIDTADLPAPLNMWRTIRTRREITFQVKTCSQVSVLLSPFPGSDSSSFYFRVIMNVAGSNRTTIDLVVGGNEGSAKILAEREVHDLLSCNSFREFYVSWWAGKITVGRGRNQGRLLSSFIKASNTSSTYHIQAASFRVPQGAAADWSMRGDIGDEFVFHTPAMGSYRNWITLLPGTSYVSFDITAGTDASIFLVEDMLSFEPRQLEVVISGWNNTRSVIREQGSQGEVYANVTHAPGLLDNWNSRTFWVRWDKSTGQIQVGGGNPLLDSGAFMSWVDPNPFSITAIAFMTAAASDGQWYFRKHMGQMTIFPTHVPIMHLNAEEAWCTVEHARSLYFTVSAQEEVSLILAEHNGDTNHDALRLVIGDANNTVTSIQTVDGGDIFLTVDTPGILDPHEAREFWVMWNDGQVQFGQGTEFGIKRLLNFQLIPVFNIRAVKFSTGYGTGDGKWGVQMWES